MARKNKQEYKCSVVNEVVQIHLCRKSPAGLRSRSEFFVQCDQGDCQYVDRNQSPCPLRLSMFAEEIREREEKARQNRENAGYYQ